MSPPNRSTKWSSFTPATPFDPIILTRTATDPFPAETRASSPAESLSSQGWYSDSGIPTPYNEETVSWSVQEMTLPGRPQKVSKRRTANTEKEIYTRTIKEVRKCILSSDDMLTFS